MVKAMMKGNTEKEGKEQKIIDYDLLLKINNFYFSFPVCRITPQKLIILLLECGSGILLVGDAY
jgi:hypothetical protein